MGNERLILCGSAEGPTKWAGRKEPLRLYLFGEHKNITLKIKDISSKFIANIEDVFVDLLEIASYVYCADQTVTRVAKPIPTWGRTGDAIYGFIYQFVD
jgi:hypothetical protein